MIRSQLHLKGVFLPIHTPKMRCHTNFAANLTGSFFSASAIYQIPLPSSPKVYGFHHVASHVTSLLNRKLERVLSGLQNKGTIYAVCLIGNPNSFASDDSCSWKVLGLLKYARGEWVTASHTGHKNTEGEFSSKELNIIPPFLLELCEVKQCNLTRW